MKVRGKFYVESITKYKDNYASVVMQARSENTIPEDQKYAEATPSGKLEMTITVPAVIEFFVPGKVVYVDIEEAPEGVSPNHT
jgi:hypothetical protein